MTISAPMPIYHITDNIRRNKREERKGGNQEISDLQSGDNKLGLLSEERSGKDDESDTNGEKNCSVRIAPTVAIPVREEIVRNQRRSEAKERRKRVQVLEDDRTKAATIASPNR